MIVALSSIGMSVSQHFCTMSKEEIEASACDMCASEDHGEDLTGASEEKSCCSDQSVHLRVDTDATGAKLPTPPQPLISASLFPALLTEESASELPPSVFSAEGSIPSFPLTQEHTVLLV